MFRAMPGTSSRRRNRRAVIIGGSMSGLFSAAFLRQIGWDVDVYERSSVELVGRGAGITGHPELLEALEASGAGTEMLGIEVPKRIAIDREGRITDERPLRQILTSWDRLQRLLRATIDEAHYHLGWNFERVEQDEHGVRVQFSGGRVEHADILIGGDGIRSSVRAQMAPEVQPVYAGYYIWRGAPNEADLAPETLNSIYPLFTFYLPKQQQVITYPIAGFNDDLTPGKRRFNFIWYRVADAAKLREMCVDEKGVQHEYSVPPPLVRKDLIAGMHKDAKEILPPPLLDAQAAFHHADLRFHRAHDYLRSRRDGRRCGGERAAAYGLRNGQGRHRCDGARETSRRARRCRRCTGRLRRRAPTNR
jgi:2-polyprenyl-6-methoxyphenol hydroxylase-like FAD-dependent oxidoreductase